MSSANTLSINLDIIPQINDSYLGSRMRTLSSTKTDWLKNFSSTDMPTSIINNLNPNTYPLYDALKDLYVNPIFYCENYPSELADKFNRVFNAPQTNQCKKKRMGNYKPTNYQNTAIWLAMCGDYIESNIIKLSDATQFKNEILPWVKYKNILGASNSGNRRLLFVPLVPVAMYYTAIGISAFLVVVTQYTIHVINSQNQGSGNGNSNIQGGGNSTTNVNEIVDEATQPIVVGPFILLPNNGSWFTEVEIPEESTPEECDSESNFYNQLRKSQTRIPSRFGGGQPHSEDSNRVTIVEVTKAKMLLL